MTVDNGAARPNWLTKYVSWAALLVAAVSLSPNMSRAKAPSPGIDQPHHYLGHSLRLTPSAYLTNITSGQHFKARLSQNSA
jgi:hypothetical protein